MSGSQGHIPQEVLDEIIARTDIVEVVGRYVPLKKRGQNYIGLCPFHHEKTPSFTVSQNKQIFYCFGCGAGGNAFKFLMQVEHLNFPEAVRKLAAEAGVQLPEREQSPEERAAAAKRARLLKWNEYAAFYYQAVLHAPQGQVYADYLARRQISEETRTTFQLGGCLAGWDGLYRYLRKKGASDEELITLGLVSPRNQGKGCYDRFRDRLMFPIKDGNGRIVAFGGRIIDAEKAPQKYINSPDSEVFHKGRMVYGLDLAKPEIRAADEVMIVEGYMDVIACHQAGIKNVVAPLGTALTKEQVKLLMRYTYNFVTSFDGDGAGIRATLKSIGLIEAAGGRARVLAIPDGMDPDEYIKAHGVEAFRALLGRASGGYAFRLAQAQQHHPGESMEQKLGVLGEVLPYLAQMKHAAELDMAIRRTADALFLSADAVKNELAAYRRSGGGRARYGEEPEEAPPPVTQVPRFAKNEVTLLAGVIEDPTYLARIEAAGGEGLFTPPLRTVYAQFRDQYGRDGQISSARLDEAASALFAQAVMQQGEGLPEGMDPAERTELLDRVVLERQLELLNRRYQVLLHKIAEIEKGGRSEDMEQALIELDTIRQRKIQFEEKLRGDRQ